MKLNIWEQKQKMIRTSKSSLSLPHSFVRGEKGSFCLLGPLRGVPVELLDKRMVLGNDLPSPYGVYLSVCAVANLFYWVWFSVPLRGVPNTIFNEMQMFFVWFFVSLRGVLDYRTNQDRGRLLVNSSVPLRGILFEDCKDVVEKKASSSVPLRGIQQKCPKSSREAPSQPDTSYKCVFIIS